MPHEPPQPMRDTRPVAAIIAAVLLVVTMISASAMINSGDTMHAPPKMAQQLVLSDDAMHAADIEVGDLGRDVEELAESKCGTSRYLQIVMSHRPGSRVIVFNEIEFYCSGKKRTGVKAVNSSKAYRTYTMDKTLDGNPGTFYAKVDRISKSDAWILYDLKTPCALSKTRWIDRGGSMRFHNLKLFGGSSLWGHDAIHNPKQIASWNNGKTNGWQEHKLTCSATLTTIKPTIKPTIAPTSKPAGLTIAPTSKPAGSCQDDDSATAWLSTHSCALLRRHGWCTVKKMVLKMAQRCPASCQKCGSAMTLTPLTPTTAGSGLGCGRATCEAATGKTCTQRLCGSCNGRGWVAVGGSNCAGAMVYPNSGKNKNGMLDCGWPRNRVSKKPCKFTSTAPTAAPTATPTSSYKAPVYISPAVIMGCQLQAVSSCIAWIKKDYEKEIKHCKGGTARNAREKQYIKHNCKKVWKYCKTKGYEDYFEDYGFVRSGCSVPCKCGY